MINKHKIKIIIYLNLFLINLLDIKIAKPKVKKQQHINIIYNFIIIYIWVVKMKK